ncbi:MAG: sulfatase, partial [Opitutus sp.]|nr:sulfatase [Opitutus sp.]
MAAMETDATPRGTAPSLVRRAGSLLAGERFGGLAIFHAVFLGIALATRGALLLKAWRDAGTGPAVIASFGWGLLFDLGAAAFASLPLIVLLALLPAGWGARAWQRALTFAAGAAILFALLFGAVAEWTFWDEFGARFNFIAVDYLVYTTEVVGNIRESYNLPLILSCLSVATALVTAVLLASGWPSRWLEQAQTPARRRWSVAAVWLAASLGYGLSLDESQLPAFANNYHRELAKNGLWSLFAAFRNNALDYDQFYATIPIDRAFARLHRELQEDGSRLVSPGARDSLRWVQGAGTELRPNVIQITVESLSADFVGRFNPASHLTPNLDEIAPHSLVFENFYATGTRTDRGMEALTLSLPP